MLKTFRFRSSAGDIRIEAQTIFDAMVEFYALYADARIDSNTATNARFDQIKELTISEIGE